MDRTWSWIFTAVVPTPSSDCGLPATGVDANQLHDGTTVVGHVGDQAVLLARSAGELFAVGATCTHYGGPLGEGLLVGDTVRCPWHHACFSLRTGEADRAPALNGVPCYAVEVRDGKAFVSGARKASARTVTASPSAPSSIVILGGGAAAQAALETLRREEYGGPITVLSADSDAPYDRPNLSKDYPAGTASDDWIPLRDALFYRQHAIDLRWTGATAIETQQLLVGPLTRSSRSLNMRCSSNERDGRRANWSGDVGSEVTKPSYTMRAIFIASAVSCVTGSKEWAVPSSSLFVPK